jgi:hypothetical protein
VEFFESQDAAVLRRDLQNHPRAYLIASDRVVGLLGPQFALRTILTAHFPCSTCGVSNDFTLFDWDVSNARISFNPIESEPTILRYAIIP